MINLKAALKTLHYYANGRKVSISGQMFTLPRILLPAFNLWHDNDYEPPLTHFLREVLKPGDTFIDVGANIGVLSLLAARLVASSGRVFAFEPNPFVYSALVQLVHANGLADRCTVFPIALDRAPGSLRLSVSAFGSQTMARTSVMKFDPNAREVNIIGCTLDTVLSPLPAVKCIKVDVEGAELNVLKGATRLVTRTHPIVCVEVHGLYFENPGEVVKPLFSLFSRIGYVSWNLLKRQRETANEFLADSGTAGWDELTQKDLSNSGYGQLVFAPKEHRKLVEQALHSA